MKLRPLIAAAMASSLLTACPAAAARVAPTGSPAAFGIHVSGNQLVNDQTGTVVQLRGINQMASGGCDGKRSQSSIIYGPHGPSSLSVLQAWHVNTVRLSVNEDCWLGINGVPPATSGPAYRNALIGYVNLLTSHHYYVIFDLHVNAPGAVVSDAEQPMADESHAPAYWTSVASTFKDNPAVIFEPYNEPDITVKNTMTSDPWGCWLNGCEATVVFTSPGVSKRMDWQIAGMQQLVDTIRATGAANVITLSGLNHANDLSGVLSHLPTDPDHQLAATFHNYEFEGCGQTCWNSTIASVGESMPVLTDEMGDPNCATSYASQYMDWADSHGVSYLPWGWELWGCANYAYGLLVNWSGTPNSYGQVFYDHFAARAAGR